MQRMKYWENWRIWMKSINIDKYGTIYNMSRKTGISLGDIIKANPNIDVRSIPSGTSINLPNTEMSSVNIDEYGTLYQIHKRTGVSVADIIKANPNIDVHNIPPHTKIKVPSSGTPIKIPPKKQKDIKDATKKQKETPVGNEPKSKCHYPKIIIDPGHGYRVGNAGTQARNCDYKSSEGTIIRKVSYDKLPSYVIKNPSKYIIKASGYTYNKTENILAYDVSHNLYNRLIKLGYPKDKVKIFRAKKKYRGTNKAKTLIERRHASNLFKADYYISIHANGSEDGKGNIRFGTKGHFTLYGTTRQEAKGKSKALAQDLMHFFTVTQKDKYGDVQISKRSLALFSTRHKAKRIALIELGYLTSPHDSLVLFSHIEKVGEQLLKGLQYNIKKEYPNCPLTKG